MPKCRKLKLKLRYITILQVTLVFSLFCLLDRSSELDQWLHIGYRLQLHTTWNKLFPTPYYSFHWHCICALAKNPSIVFQGVILSLLNLLLDHVFSLSKLWINFVYSLSTFFWAINLTNLLYYPFRSSHRRCFVRKSVLRNFEKFTRKHLFFNKKKTLWKKRSGTDIFLWILRNL